VKGKATFLEHKINFEAHGSKNIQRLQKSIGKKIQVEATVCNSNFDLKILQIVNINNQDEIEQLTNSNRELQNKLEQIRTQVTDLADAKVKSTVKAKYVTSIKTINNILS
ncbi:MAG: hypothetical protein WBM44_17140, partial [Waterburya sp.]